ncbi:MAG: 2-hydroxyacyl-CoA dehydratase, partial [Deltaproteobacteria bacterium]|nr:2-hydroxyacyl-CoA dehydratase [Deltaproteobacteria bacterium]
SPVLQRIRYHAVVDLGARALLRAQRLQGEWKDRRRRPRPGALFAPPLPVVPWFKELVFRHYLAGRYASGARPVAWVTSGAPVEYLKALGYFIHYPENHAAMCGVRRTAVEAMEAAEAAGYSRDICSYARTDIGTVLTGKTLVGRLPKPDLLVCCTNICQTVLAWYRVLAEETGAELVLIDTPFLYDEAPPHALAYVKRQVEEAIAVAERVAGRTLSPRRLEEVGRLSQDAAQLWSEVMARGRHRPAPLTVFDQFILMGPIVEMRGDVETIRFYEAMLRALDRRIEAGVGAIRDERRRLLWDNLPIWYRVRRLSELLAERGAACVASTYTNAWGELASMMEPGRPLESMARVYLHPILNRSTQHKLDTMRRMVGDFHLDGAILHSDRSCKPYSIGQVDQRDRLVNALGVPALLLEADHSDERVYGDEQADNRVVAFLELLEG